MFSSLLVFFMLAQLATADPILTAGDYGDLHIAFEEKTGQISGVFEKTVDENAECVFAFSGRLIRKEAKLRAFSLSHQKQSMTGALQLMSNGMVRISLAAEPVGCKGSPHFSEKLHPAIYVLKKATGNRFLRVLKKDNPIVYQESVAKDGRQQKWKSGEAFAVSEERVDWVRLILENKTAFTWMQESDFYPLYHADPLNDTKEEEETLQ